MELNEAENQISELRKKLNYYNETYYIQDNPVISDYEYDMLLQQLEKLEEEFPQLITSASPTQRVGGEAAAKFSPVVHNVQIGRASCRERV